MAGGSGYNAEFERRCSSVKRGLQFPWREAGPPNYLDDKVDANQWVVNKEFSFMGSGAPAPLGDYFEVNVMDALGW